VRPQQYVLKLCEQRGRDDELELAVAPVIDDSAGRSFCVEEARDENARSRTTRSG
jgi:hypothetical protein